MTYRKPWPYHLLACMLLALMVPGVTHAEDRLPPILVVTIRDTQGVGVAGITVVVRDRSGQRVFARSLTNVEGVATIASVPTPDVRVAIEGQLPRGAALTHTGADALGIAMTLALPPNALDLRVEPDGRVVPDPTTMIDLDPGIVAVAAPMPTAVLATPTGIQGVSSPRAIAAMPCVLVLDQVSGPFTFLPLGDQEYYAADLGDTPTGQQFAVSVRATSGLDLRTTITQAGLASPLDVLSTPAISTTLPVTTSGWLLLRVENRAAALPRGESYTIELRLILPPPSTARDAGGIPIVASPDALENNWSPETAAPIAIGVIYDLTFACPESWAGACPGGDHDYLRVPVKAGSRYQLATFDLGPGVDTVLDLFWGDMQTQLRANDDAFGGGFASMVQWVAPANGDLIIRIAPRNGALLLVVPSTRSSTTTNTGTSASAGTGGYRFAIALQQSALASQILSRVASAANVTLPTPAAGSAGSTGALATPIVATPASDGATGQAVVIAPEGTVLRESPDRQSTAIQTLAVEGVVTLTGQASGSWVRVQPQEGVVPGWVYGPDLQPRSTAPTPEATVPEAGSNTTAPGPSINAPTLLPTPAVSAVIRIERLPPRPLPPAPAALPRTSFTVQVIIGSTAPVAIVPTPQTGGPTPTPLPMRVLAGVRVQLITVFGEVLTEAITPADGTLTFTRELGPQTALRLRIPGAGIELPLDPSQATLTIAFPQGGQ